MARRDLIGIVLRRIVDHDYFGVKWNWSGHLALQSDRIERSGQCGCGVSRWHDDGDGYVHIRNNPRSQCYCQAVEIAIRLSSHVISETIDNETIVVNTRDGSYFSLVGSASLTWIAVQSGSSLSELQLPDFAMLRRLGEFGLLEVNIDVSWPEYSGDEIMKYDDMEEMLLLDPIHEVDEHGWPIPRST